MTFTYNLKEPLPTKKQRRKEAAKGPNSKYPSLDELRAETEEEEPALLFTIADADGTPVQTVTGPPAAGVHRLTWDLRLPGADLAAPPASPREPDEERARGHWPRAVRGSRQVPGEISQRVNGVVTKLAGPVEFAVRYVGPQPLPADDLKELAAFQRDVLRLQRDLNAATSTAGELAGRLEQVKAALDATPAAPAESAGGGAQVNCRAPGDVALLRGDAFLQGRWENAPTSIAERVATAAAATRTVIDSPTGTQREQLKIARAELDHETAKLPTARGEGPEGAGTVARQARRPVDARAAAGRKGEVKAVGLEPTTNGLKVRCSTD